MAATLTPQAYDYLDRYTGRQYRPTPLLASARRMQRAGLERFLSAAERRLIADNDNVDPSTSAAAPKRGAGPRHGMALKRNADVTIPVSWEGV